MIEPQRYQPKPYAMTFMSETNDMHISRHSAKPQPAPLPKHSVTLAYGSLAYPQLTHQLSHDDLSVRRKALVSLMDLFHKPQNVALGLESGVVAAVTHLLSDEDVVIRIYSTDVLATISQHNIAIPPMIEAETYEKLVSMLGEESKALRDNIYRCLIHSCKVDSALERIVQCGIIKELAHRMSTEPHDILIHMLTLLWFAIKNDEALMQALVHDCIKQVAVCLQHEETLVKELAARALACLAYPFDGKLQALEANLVPVLIELVYDPSDRVKLQAASSLVSITVEEKGKVAVVEEPQFPTFLNELLNHPSDPIRLEAVKTMGNVAENVKGRAALLPSVPALETLRDTSEDKLLIRHVKSAIKVITFTP